MTMSDIFDGKCSREIGFTLRCGGRDSGVHDRRNWDCYIVDGKEARLSTKEGNRMQGFPEKFIFPASKTQAMKQLVYTVIFKILNIICIFLHGKLFFKGPVSSHTGACQHKICMT